MKIPTEWVMVSSVRALKMWSIYLTLIILNPKSQEPCRGRNRECGVFFVVVVFRVRIEKDPLVGLAEGEQEQPL